MPPLELHERVIVAMIVARENPGRKALVKVKAKYISSGEKLQSQPHPWRGRYQ